MKLATAATAISLLGATFVAAQPASAQPFCGPFFPLCVAGAAVGAAATIATLPFAAAAAVTAPYAYAPGPAYYPAPRPYYPAYYPAPAYYAPAYPAYGYYYGPRVAVGARAYYGHRVYWGGHPGRWHHY